MVRAVVRLRPLGAGDLGDRRARATADRVARSTLLDTGGGRRGRAGRRAGGVLAADDPARARSADVRRPGEPAGGAVLPRGHRRRAAVVRAGAPVAGSQRCRRGGRLGSGCRDRGGRPDDRWTPRRLAPVAGRSGGRGVRRGRQRGGRGGGARARSGPDAVRAAGRGRDRHRARDHGRAGGPDPRRAAAGLVRGDVRRRAGGRGAPAGRHEHRAHRRRRRPRPAACVPRPARRRPDRPARADPLRRGPRRRGGRGRRRRGPGARRTARAAGGHRGPPAARGRGGRRPTRGRQRARGARARAVAGPLAAGIGPDERQRGEHRAADGPTTGVRDVPDRGVPRRPRRHGTTTAARVGPGVHGARAGRPREGRTPRVGGPGPRALPRARGAGRPHRRRRGQHVRAPGGAGARDARRRRHDTLPHRPAGDDRRPWCRRRPGGLDGAAGGTTVADRGTDTGCSGACTEARRATAHVGGGP